MARLRVGLLGGSFNPAHEGHRHISLHALSRLALDQVWWMVSPGNPLKRPAGMMSFADRLASARARARHPRIHPTAIERDLGTVHTVDTIAALQARFPDVRFVWLMGADNLEQISQWKGWRRLFTRVPIAVFPRPTYSLRALGGKAAHTFARNRVRAETAARLCEMQPPAWVFLPIRSHVASATAIRARRGPAREEDRTQPAMGQTG